MIFQDRDFPKPGFYVLSYGVPRVFSEICVWGFLDMGLAVVAGWKAKRKITKRYTISEQKENKVAGSRLE